MTLSNFCAMLRCSQEKLHQKLCRVLALSGFRVSALGLLPPPQPCITPKSQALLAEAQPVVRRQEMEAQPEGHAQV